jgi:hypothetical protein
MSHLVSNSGDVGYTIFMIVTATILLALAFTIILLSNTKVVSAQSNIINDNFESNSNLTISSPNKQTSNLGQQEQANNSTTTDNNNTSSQRLPIISEISDKGAYRVELRWSSPLDIQSPTIISDGGFDIEVLFLNASVPEATPQTIPGGQTNLTSVRRVELF